MPAIRVGSDREIVGPPPDGKEHSRLYASNGRLINNLGLYLGERLLAGGHLLREPSLGSQREGDLRMRAIEGNGMRKARGDAGRGGRG